MPPHTIVTPKDQRQVRAEALLNRLKSVHSVLKHCRPLVEDEIETALIAAHPKEKAWLLRAALHQHLNSHGYLQALSHGGVRYRLDGTEAGEVETEKRHHAHSLLKHQHGRHGAE